MSHLTPILSNVSFWLLAIPLIAGPWCFGSWEKWWFWPMTAIIFLSTACFALKLILDRENIEKPDKSLKVVLISIVPFMLYAAVRVALTDVYMTAERSYLLFLTPLLIGIQIVFAFSTRQRWLMHRLIMINLFLIGAYAIANHLITQNEYVLWAKGYPQYVNDNRATGPMFCPDHLAGIMEIALCMCLGILMSRRRAPIEKIFPAILALISIACVILSKSRGGGITLVGIIAATIIWGFVQWRPAKAWYYRSVSTVFLVLLVLLFAAAGSRYMDRFTSYFGAKAMKKKPLAEKVEILQKTLRTTSRGHMISGALNSWKEKPIFGIGAGMHQIVWPRFAYSMDGDRESGKRPTHQWTGTYSFEVHSDWVQLMQEYGVVGLFLFLIPAGTVFVVTLKRRKQSLALGLGAALSIVAMSIHSFGDFNLQIPAITWVFGVVVALPMYRSKRKAEDDQSGERFRI